MYVILPCLSQTNFMRTGSLQKDDLVKYMNHLRPIKPTLR